MPSNPIVVAVAGQASASVGTMPLVDSTGTVAATAYDALTAAALAIGAATATAVNIGKAAVPVQAATGGTAGFDCQTAAALTIGGTNATGVTLGKAGVNTTLGAKLVVPAATSKTADIVAGTSFIIRSFVSSTAGAATAATTDTSTVAWFIVN